MSEESYCEKDWGLDYKCDQPLPRSVRNESGPICGSVAEFLYDPANCDPGWWCGCSSTNASECVPSNDRSFTKWGGHFTTTDSGGNEIVLYGQFNEGDGECPLSFYCPGKSKIETCVDLCPPRSYCPDPSQSLDCREDYYCPVGSFEGKKCINMESCGSTGLRRFEVGPAMSLMIFILIVSVAYLFLGRHLVVRNARRRKEAMMASKRQMTESGKQVGGDDDDDDDQEGEEQAKEVEEGEEIESPAPKKERRRSTLSSPDMTIDIECERLRLTIPKVGTIMRGVSGKLEHGKLTAIMGPSGAGESALHISSCKLFC